MGCQGIDCIGPREARPPWVLSVRSRHSGPLWDPGRSGRGVLKDGRSASGRARTGGGSRDADERYEHIDAHDLGTFSMF